MPYTKEQQQFIDHQGRHAKCTAVAGSGKSTALAGLIKQAIQAGTDPRRITVIMFNVSARESFTGKLKQEIGENIPDVRTFNSMGERLTRFFQDRGWLPQYRLVTETYIIESLARRALQETLPSKVTLDDETQESFLSFIDYVKSSLSATDIVFDDSSFTQKFFIKAYDRFEQLRKDKKLRFFSDQVYAVTQLIQSNSLARKAVENHVDLILVDEFQDTNEVQLGLITAIAGSRAKVIVVGDADQSIYGFRGADPSILTTTFDEYFADPDLYRLSYTFRYGHRLSLLANHVINHNFDRADTFCISHETCPDTKISLLQSDDASQIIIAQIHQWQKSGQSQDLSVLFRLKSQATQLVLELLTAGIPFTLKNIDYPLTNRYAQALIAVLHFANGTLFSHAKDTLTALLKAFPVGLNNQDLEQAVEECANKRNCGPLYGLSNQIKKQYPKIKFLQRLDLIQSFAATRLPAHQVVARFIEESELIKTIEKTTSTTSGIEEKKQLLNGLTAYLKNHRFTVTQALEHLQDMEAHIAKASSDSSVYISTVHAAKGLEWDHVIVAGLEEGLFPFTHRKDAIDIEAERRLFYVACTRARQSLLLVAPEDPYLLKSLQAKSSYYPDISSLSASRFLFESNISLCNLLGEALSSGDLSVLNTLKIDAPEVANYYLKQLSLSAQIECAPNVPRTSVDKQRLRAGCVIEHPRFGRGKIVEKVGRNYRIEFARKNAVFDLSVVDYRILS